MTQRQRKLAALGIVLMGVIVVAGGIYGFRGPLARQLHAWKVLPSSERFTELYFSDVQHLPSTYRPNKPLTVHFWVRNREGVPKTYRYTVMASGGSLAQLASGSFMLSPGAAREETAAILVPDIGARGQIVVQLIDQRQTISFWLKKETTS